METYNICPFGYGLFHLAYFSKAVKFLKRRYQGLGGGGNRELLLNWHRVSVSSGANILKMDSGDDSTTL